MFLAPLNYDRFFKKIFSDKKIAKRFLEDFFEVTIEEIELVSDIYVKDDVFTEMIRKLSHKSLDAEDLSFDIVGLTVADIEQLKC